MVFKNSIYLFKTPLDANYQNVYDEYDSETRYFGFLQLAFSDYKMITFSNITSRKNVGDNFELVVSGYDSMDLHDYNYMRFVDGNDKPLYAFILSVESMNDNQTLVEGVKQSSCLLKCELDVWTNHYLEIKNDYAKVNENRCTYDTNTLPFFPSSIYNNKTAENILVNRPFTFSKVVSQESPPPPSKYIVLWQRVMVSDYCYLQVSTASTNPPDYMSDCNRSENEGGFAFYRPAGVIKQEYNSTKKITTFSFVHLPIALIFDGIPVNGQGEPQSPTVITLAGRNYDGEVSVVVTENSAVLSSKLTYYAPFSYIAEEVSVEGGTSYIAIVLGDSQSSYYFRYGSRLYLQGSHALIASTGSGQDVFLYLNNHDIDETVVEHEIDFSKVQYVSTRRYQSAGNTFNYSDIEQVCNSYPLDYYSLKNQFIDIPLIPSIKSEKCYLTLECNQKVTPVIRIEMEEGNSIANVAIENPTEVFAVKNQLNEYLMRNQNSVNFKIAFAGARLGGSSVSALSMMSLPRAINGVLNYAQTIGEEYSKQADFANYPDEGVLPASNSAVNNYILDCVYIVRHISKLKEEIGENYHTYGYNVSMPLSLFSFRRDCFDIDCGELTLSSRMADEDKRKIVKAVSSGICRWHIRNAYLQTQSVRRNVLKAMNRAVSNYPISLIP